MHGVHLQDTHYMHTHQCKKSLLF